MKLVKTLSLITIASIFAGCGLFNQSSNGTSKGSSEGETLLEMYCNGDEFLNNKEYFRATGIGESMDQMTANKKARSNAQAELAKTLNSTMKIVTDNYVKSSEVNNQEELTERFEELSRTVVNQQLEGARKICEKYTKTKEGNYKCYMALELSGKDMLAKYNEQIIADPTTKVDYDYDKFKKTFDEEMLKLEQQNN
jgi:hypothetical protein